MGIARAALIIALGSVAGRLLGLGRQQTMAWLFGQGPETDAFTAALRVPLTVHEFLVGGLISAALVPVFSGYADEAEEDLWRLASCIFHLAAGALVVASAGGLLLAPWLMGVLVGTGFAGELHALSTLLLQLMLPAVVFMGLSGVTTAVLYARRRFTLPAFGAAVFNAGFILVALLFHQRLGIASLAAGVLVGALLQMALQLPGLAATGFRWRPALWHAAVRRIGRLYLPVAAGLIVSAAGVFIDTNLAAQTPRGDLTAMQYATTLVQFPLGLVATAISFAVLPTLSRQAAADAAGFRLTLAYGLKLVVLAILPATVGLVILREPVVRLLFEHGAFTAENSGRTALAFLAYAPGLPMAAVDQVLIFAFYARQNTWKPALVGVAAIGVYLVVALSLIGPLGMPGLALANSVQWTAHALIMLALLWPAVGGLRGQGLGPVLAKSLLATGLLAATLLALWPWLAATLASGGVPGLALALAAAIAAGATVYGAAITALGVQEAGAFWRLARARLVRGNGAV